MIDIIMTTTTVILCYAMIPQIVKSVQEKNVCIAWQTLILTTLGIVVLTCCFYNLGLMFNTLANGLIGLMWLSLIIMKILYKKT